MSASRKTRYLAERSLLEFFNRHTTTYYWTFTFAENVTDKEVVENRLKPLRDMIRRRGGEELHFWERQQRGAFHVHLVTNVYLAVVLLRPWMVERGWGPIMRVERVRNSAETLADDFSGRPRNWKRERLVRYLLKYLTKSLNEGHRWEKQFGCSATARAGNTRFKWAPWINASSMLFAAGLEIWMATQDRLHYPRAHDIAAVIRIGYEVSGWRDVDPWFLESG